MTERQEKMLRAGLTKRGYQRVRDRGEGMALAWTMSREWLAPEVLDGDTFRTTPAGKAALRAHRLKRAQRTCRALGVAVPARLPPKDR